MTDREYTIAFIDWTLTIMRMEWTEATEKSDKMKWFERINQALDRRCDMMKLVAYDREQEGKSKGPLKKNNKKPVPPPPSLG